MSCNSNVENHIRIWMYLLCYEHKVRKNETHLTIHIIEATRKIRIIFILKIHRAYNTQHTLDNILNIFIFT